MGMCVKTEKARDGNQGSKCLGDVGSNIFSCEFSWRIFGKRANSDRVRHEIFLHNACSSLVRKSLSHQERQPKISFHNHSKALTSNDFRNYCVNFPHIPFDALSVMSKETSKDVSWIHKSVLMISSWNCFMGRRLSSMRISLKNKNSLRRFEISFDIFQNYPVHYHSFFFRLRSTMTAMNVVQRKIIISLLTLDENMTFKIFHRRFLLNAFKNFFSFGHLTKE